MQQNFRICLTEVKTRTVSKCLTPSTDFSWERLGRLQRTQSYSGLGLRAGLLVREAVSNTQAAQAERCAGECKAGLGRGQEILAPGSGPDCRSTHNIYEVTATMKISEGKRRW